MSQASAGASRTRSKAHNKGRNKARKGPIVRPLSPHLQVWRWHVTMLGSILHRASGAALYAGAALVCAWLAALAAGPAFYGIFLTVIAGPIGLLVWFGLTLSAFYHLASGLRHLLWDTGAGLKPKTASALATLSIWFAVIATLAYWGWLLVAGKVWL
jgi:succinate dehydrogenase / fumarate reductase cytochrome b subunit